MRQKIHYVKTGEGLLSSMECKGFPVQSLVTPDSQVEGYVRKHSLRDPGSVDDIYWMDQYSASLESAKYVHM